MAQNVPMVIEIDSSKLRQSDLVPDEDYMEQLVRAQNKFSMFDPFLASKKINERTIWFRDHVHDLAKRVKAFSWQESVRAMGTCAYTGTIPLKAITKIIVLDPRESAHLLHMYLQPEISMANYRHCGKQYRYWTAKIFDREPSPRDVPQAVTLAGETRYEFPIDFPVKGLHGREIVFPAA